MSVVPAEQGQSPGQQMVAQVRSPQFKDQVALALPEDVKPERFVRAVVTALLASPDMQTSDADALFLAAMKAAQDGLLPDGREAAFVLFKGKAAYLPMIGGLRKIAAEYGWTIRTQVVYANDAFDWELGLEPTLRHRQTRPGEARGEMVAAYAIATHRDGRREFEVMQAEEIAKARAVSRAKDSGPWRDWPERMWEKTVGKRLFAKLALDPGDKRVASMLTDGVGDPVAAVYGGPRATIEHRPVAGELPPATDTPREPGDTGMPGGQQAVGGPESAEPAAAPDDDPEPQVQVAAAAEPEVKKPTITVARKVELPHGVNQGLKLGDLASADGAHTTFGWFLRHLDEYPPEVAAAIQVVAEKDVAEVWAEHEGRRGS